MNIDSILSIKDIQLLIEDAHKAPVNEDGSSNMWDLLPKIPYDCLPDELKKEADSVINIESAKRFLYECYPVGHFDKLAADPTKFNEQIQQALHAARYLVESTDLTPPAKTGVEAVDKANYEDWQPVSLIGGDFLKAWQDITQDENSSSKEIAITSSKALPNLIATISKKLDLPIDKGNREFWGLMVDTDGQYQLGVKTLRKKDENSGKSSLILICIDMSANDSSIKLNREITTYDKYVYMAVDALYRANDSHIMTVSNIYRQMGNNSNPSSADTQKILNSLKKMGNTTVSMNNEIERATYPNYPEIKYEGKMLEFRQITITANGKPTEGAIKVLDELPLMTVARERKQFTTIKRELLAAPVSKTPENMDIMDILLDRIAIMKNKPKFDRKILFDYIFDLAKIRTSKQRQRAPAKIYKILEHYIECGYIKGYKKSTDGIIILL